MSACKRKIGNAVGRSSNVTHPQDIPHGQTVLRRLYTVTGTMAFSTSISNARDPCHPVSYVCHTCPHRTSAWMRTITNAVGRSLNRHSQDITQCQKISFGGPAKCYGQAVVLHHFFEYPQTVRSSELVFVVLVGPA